MNLRIFDLKILSVSELRMLESNLFHSSMVDGKYEFYLCYLCFIYFLYFIYVFILPSHVICFNKYKF